MVGVVSFMAVVVRDVVGVVCDLVGWIGHPYPVLFGILFMQVVCILHRVQRFKLVLSPDVYISPSQQASLSLETFSFRYTGFFYALQ